MKLRGFSLIELLTAIAIVSVLAAILYPIFAQAKRQAKTTACVGNLKQFGSSLALYEGEWDEHFPFAPSPWWSYLRRTGQIEDPLPSCDVRDLLRPYGIGESVWRCPEDRIEASARKGWTADSYFAATGGSYRYDQDAAFDGLSLPSLERPSDWSQMMDVTAPHGGSNEFFAPGRRSNVLFYDLHVKSVAENACNGTLRPGLLE